ncbi:MAG: biopolymer transporter ExbD [Thermodesulfobacteriota bacterium]|nr:biopolymer transporter ExbD [Thermodesulfobacteriota bacterium]
MKIKARREFRVTLESLAFTDIILNIFIFFFTAFSLIYTFNPMRESRIIIKLPQADIKMPPDQKEPIIVTINSQNELFLSNKSTNLRELKKELEALIAFNKTRPVIIRADKGVVFDRVVQVLDVAKNSGVERLGIAIEEKPLSPPPKP